MENNKNTYTGTIEINLTETINEMLAVMKKFVSDNRIDEKIRFEYLNELEKIRLKDENKNK